MAKSSPSNLLFFMSDQQAANSLGCYGNSFVQTPNLNRLAAEGVRFDCNISNSPVCMPARASLITGRSPEAHGCFRNGLEIREAALPIFPEILRQSGFRTVWSGKHHWRNQMEGIPGQGRYFGFDEHHLTDDNQIGPYFDWVCEQGDEYREMVTGTLFNLPLQANPFWDGRAFISASEIQEMRAKHIEPRMLHPDRNVSYWVSPLPDELTQNAWIADRTIEAIRNHPRDGRPFFIAASFVDPHDPYNPTERFFRELDPAQCPPRRIRAGEHDASPPHYQRYIAAQTEHAWINRLLKHTEEEWQMLRTCYFAKVGAVDYHIGRVLDALAEAGLDQDTSIVFTSDHGDMIGDHGMITKGDFHYDSCIRTPLIIRPARASQEQSNLVCQTPTNLLDLFPTFLDLAGVEKPSELLLEGESLCRAWENPADFQREFTVSEIFATVDGTHHPSQWAKTLRNHQWRFTWFPGGTYGQLFDLQKDPDEYENRWNDPAYASIREALRERLFELLTTRCAPLPSSRYPV